MASNSNPEIEITSDIEAALERLFNDAKIGAENGMKLPKYSGRFMDDIDDDVNFIRSELDIEL